MTGITRKPPPGAREVSKPTKVAGMVLVAALIAHWFADDRTVRLGLLWLAAASLLWIAYRAMSLMFGQIRRDVRVARLLRTGRAEEALRLLDEGARRAGSGTLLAINKINRAAALHQLGRWTDAAAVLDGVDVRKLRGTARTVFLLNSLSVLLHTDVQRARSLFEEHRSVFQGERGRRAVAEVQMRTLAIYRLIAEDDLSTAAIFQDALDSATDDLARASNEYYLGLIDAKKGDLAAAHEHWERATMLHPAGGWSELGQFHEPRVRDM